MERTADHQPITLKGQISLEFLKKRNFTGSCRGMRYNLYRQDDRLVAAVYPQPNCWECTPEEKKTYEYFELSGEGLEAAVAWLNESYKNRDWSEKGGVF
ncbi:MAG: GNAT family acetyltransferase [Lachnospiraceae bacterium]|nr:GNAT family acetyltransferase [Lachnospiraceae bacterium]